MAAIPQLLSLRVAEARPLNSLIRLLRLVAPDGSALPGFTAGAHLRVQVTLPEGKTDWRHYSLIDFRAEPGATEAPREYVIAVRREDEGRGGSRFMHERVQPGDVPPSRRRRTNSRCARWTAARC
jgi:vanillate O-demethylase ferredoxin subunit